MFGSRPPFSGNSSFSGFGNTANTQQSTGFGASGFGRTNTFGTQAAGTGFGAAATSSTPFGAAGATGSSLFGTAGQTTANPSTGLFGSGASTGFGAATTGGFSGTTSNTGGGLFGSQSTAAAPSTGLFGSSASTGGAFNTQQKPFGFSTPTSGAAGGGLFNTASTGTGLFGAAAGGSNVVGTTVKYQPVTGTDTMTRNGVTNNIQTRIEVITCMKEYENKSLEELRVEDYLANRKGPGQGGGLIGGAFGQTTTGGGLFGSTGSTLGGGATGGLFGQKPADNKPLFGTATNTGFGAAASSTGGSLFGQTNTAPAFGQAAATNTAQPGGFSFGQNTQQPQQNKTGFSFLPTNNTTSGGLFGQQPAQTNTGFGTTNTGFSFGQTATSQQNQTGGLFNQAKPAFGAAAPAAGGGLFGTKTAAAPAFGGFSTGTTGFGTSSTTTPFGTNTNTNTGGGLFGSTQNKPAFGLGTASTFGATNTGGFSAGTSGGGLFGNTNSGGLFGNNANQNKAAGGLSFNTGTGFNTGTNTLGFGLNNNNANKPTGFGALGGGFGMGTTTLGANTGFMANNQAVAGGIGDNNIANLIKALTDNPFGHSSLLKTPVATTGAANELLCPAGSSSSKAVASGTGPPPTYVLPSNKTASGGALQPRPHSGATSSSTGGVNASLLSNRSLLFAGLDDTTDANGGDEIFKTKSYPSVKKLNLKVFNNLKNGCPASPQPGSGASSPLVAVGEGGQSPYPLTTPLHRPSSSPPVSTASPAADFNSNDTTATPDIIKGRNNMKRLSHTYKKPQTGFNDTLAALNVACRGVLGKQVKGVNGDGVAGDGAANTSLSGGAANASLANFSLYEASSQDFSEADLSGQQQPHPTGIKLTRSGYYTIPSLDELSSLIDDNGQCLVENFSVGREGYGNICFVSETDVMGLDLDSAVFIVRKEVEVYPDAATKPKVGEGLNKTAVITLDAVWPVDKSTRDVIKDNSRLESMGWPRYLEKKCLNMGAKFLEYRADTGSWVFKVNHFSKYGLQDDNDDEEFSPEDVMRAQHQQLQMQQQKLQQQQQLRQMNQQLRQINQQNVSSDQGSYRKTSDTSLIKSSSKGSGSSGACPSTPPPTVTADAGAGEGSVTTSSSSGGSLSSSSSGLGGDQPRGGPPTLSLLSPPPTHHLLPQQDGAPQQHTLKGSPPGGGAQSPGRSLTTAAAATVPGEHFLSDASFAHEPHEGASLGASSLLPRPGYSYGEQAGGVKNRTLQQLTSNMFPMDEDEEDMEDYGGGGSTTLLGGGVDMEMTCVTSTGQHQAADSSVLVPWKDTTTSSSIKKFAGRRLDADPGAECSAEGRMSPSVGQHTVVKPKQQQLLVQQRGAGISSPRSAYRSPRTEYPTLPSGGGRVSHPTVVAPLHSADIVPLQRSLLSGQHSSLKDTGAFMSSSFRVGWGPCWQLAHAGPPLGTQVDVVGATVAKERRAASSSHSTGPAPYLFLPGGAPAAAHLTSAAAADQPSYKIKVAKLHLTDLSAASESSPDPNTALRTLEACLVEVLRYSNSGKTVSSSSSAPQLSPIPGRALLHRMADTVHQCGQAGSHLSAIFDLCMALWGKLDYAWLEDAASDSEYVLARARVETLSRWVERVSRDTVRQEVRSVLENGSTEEEEAYLDAVFSHLTAREIYDACSLLQEKGDHHLALLLAQICMGDDTPRQIVYKQLCNWSECGADTTISRGRLALFVLASGRATHTTGAGLINICQGLDWRRALAIHLWYLCPSTCTINEALAEYERGAGLLKDDAASGGAPYCEEPLPQYLADHTLPDSASRVSFDICYHLLKLYTDSSYRLDQLLNPATCTPDPLDVTTSWLVMTLIQSLGYQHVNSVVANGIHLAMAAHLEAAGLWHWAIFVLLSLKEEKCRAAEVRAVLTRHVEVVEGIELEDDAFMQQCKDKSEEQNLAPDVVVAAAVALAAHAMDVTVGVDGDTRQTMEDDDVGFVDGEEENSMDDDFIRQRQQQRPEAVSCSPAAVDQDSSLDSSSLDDDSIADLSTYEQREKFLINKLRIPELWINECKAVLARSLGLVEEEAWYLIKAGDLKKAHGLLIDVIAPNAIINEDHEYLNRYITAFEGSSAPNAVDMKVSEWKEGGGVYAHYLHVLAAVEEIKASQQPTQDKVEALRPRLLALCERLNKLRTPTARHRLCVSEVSRVVVGVLRAVLGDDLVATTAIANQVAGLPLSRDCALMELNALTHQYLAGIAS